MKTIFALLLLLPLVSFSQSRVPYSVEYVEHVMKVSPNGSIQCVQEARDQSFIEQLQKNAAAAGLHILKETLRPRSKAQTEGVRRLRD
jgi:hypothetical protein